MVLAAALFSLLAAATPATPAPAPAPSSTFFQSHREKLLAGLPEGAISVFRAAAESPADTRAETYRQDSDFWYLTGFDEPDAVAVFRAGRGRGQRYILFVRPRDFAEEQWTGWRDGRRRREEGVSAPTQAYPSRSSGPLPEPRGAARRPCTTATAATRSSASSCSTPGTPATRTPCLRAPPPTRAAPVARAASRQGRGRDQRLLRRAAGLSAEAHRRPWRRRGPAVTSTT